MIELNMLVENALYGVAMLASGYFMWRIKRLNDKVDASVTREDVKEMIEDKLEPVAVEIRHLREDTKAHNKKLDHLIELMIQD